MVLISIPGLAFWAFGIPLFFAWSLRRFLEDLEEAKLHSDPKEYETLQHRFRLRLGFLTSGFVDEFYYWEVVLLLRKTILVLMMTFLAPISAGV